MYLESFFKSRKFTKTYSVHSFYLTAAFGETNEAKYCNKDGTSGPLVSGSALTKACTDVNTGNPKNCDYKLCCEPFLAVDPAPIAPEPIQ